MDRILFWSQGPQEFRFLGNFYIAPFSVSDSDHTYPTVEHFYQSCKATNDSDFNQVMTSRTPWEAKYRARKFVLAPDWDAMKVGIMLHGVRMKFKCNPDLVSMLLATHGFDLVHYAPWGDIFWGVGKYYQGQNNLGKILMQVREEFREQDRK